MNATQGKPEVPPGIAQAGQDAASAGNRTGRARLALASGSSLPVLAIAVLCSPPGCIHTTAVVCLYMACGPLLILLNNHIMHSLAFDYPITLCALGITTSAAFSHLAVGLRLVRIGEGAADVMRGWKWFRVALPIGILKALGLAAGIELYMYLGVGIIQMFKALNPVIVICVQRVLAPSLLPSPAAIGCAGVIVAGTLLQMRGEVALSLTGLALVLISDVGEATALVMGEVLLRVKSLTPMETLYFVAPAIALNLGFMAAVLEWPRLVKRDGFSVATQHPEYFIACAVLGVVVNFLSFMAVQATSAVTLKILGPVRTIALVMVGVFFCNETVSALTAVGYMISLFGFAAYHYVQMRGGRAWGSSKDVQDVTEPHVGQ